MKRLLLAALCAATFSACGGGGGGGTSAPPTPSTPAATPTPPAILTTSVQRADTTQALTSYRGSAQATGYAGIGGTPIAAVRRHVDAAATRVTAAYRMGIRAASTARRAESVTYSACSNGLESGSVTVSSAEVQLYERVFYDAACTQLYQDIFLDVIATSPASGTATGTATVYNLNGAVFDYETLALTINGMGTGSGSFSIIATDAQSPSSPTSAKIGVACNVATNALGCGIGAIARESSISQDIGATLGVNVAVSTGSAGTLNVPVSGSASAYTGALGALSLGLGAFPSFVVSGGSVIDSATLSGSFTYTQNGALAGVSFTLTDAAADGTVAITSSGTPVSTINGAVKRTSTGQVVATFTTDIAGNGTITYGNGATGQIVHWNVFG